MNYKIEQFIGLFDDIVDPVFCDKVIEHYKAMEQMNKTFSRQYLEGVSKLKKDTMSYSLLDDLDTEVVHSNGQFAFQFSEAVAKANLVYSDFYGILTDVAPYKISETVKIQKTEPGQGYHQWHCEHANQSYGRRVLQAILYLNDVEKGGETEFLYQGLRVSPKKGLLLLFPAAFTHVHRGNPPLEGSKYIMNTWLEYIQ